MMYQHSEKCADRDPRIYFSKRSVTLTLRDIAADEFIKPSR